MADRFSAVRNRNRSTQLACQLAEKQSRRRIMKSWKRGLDNRGLEPIEEDPEGEELAAAMAAAAETTSV